MSNKPNGGPAFARPESEYVNAYKAKTAYPAQTGMTLRDYFAAKAMQSLLIADENFSSDAEAGAPMRTWDDYAKGAYQIADAMLAERNKP